MSTAKQIYGLGFDQCVSLVTATGATNTIIIEGEMGIGKSALLWAIQKLNEHPSFYFECNSTQPEDLMGPNLKLMEQGILKFSPNENLGLHIDGPTNVMYDEFGKNRSIHNPVSRDLHERTLCGIKRHPDSIVFATTNLSAEGLGDIMQDHARNRVTVVRMRKPTPKEWLAWAVNNGIEVSIMSWVKDEPRLMQSFLDVADPDDNPYIHHPKDPSRTAFVTPRSLHKASDIIAVRDQFDDVTLTAALIGTLGERGAMDFAARLKLQDELPAHQDIIDDPLNARVPTSAAAVCMVVFRALGQLERSTITPWMHYLNRLDAEAQGLFANGVRNSNYSKRTDVMNNAEYGQWAVKNNHMFSKDVE
jgi:hypothetical protein